jgi:hypothetical protein
MKKIEEEINAEVEMTHKIVINALEKLAKAGIHPYPVILCLNDQIIDLSRLISMTKPELFELLERQYKERLEDETDQSKNNGPKILPDPSLN